MLLEKQQKEIDEKLNETGPSIRKREKVMKSISKGAFLDMLKGTSPNVSVDVPDKHSKVVSVLNYFCGPICQVIS